MNNIQTTALGPVEKTVIPNTPIRFLIYVTKPFKIWAFLAIIVVIVAAILGQSLALVFKWIIEAVERGDTHAALMYGLIYPIAMLAVQLLWRLSGYFGTLWMINAKTYAGDVLVTHTLRHSHSYFIDRFAGSLLTKVTNVVGAIDGFVHDFLWSILSTVVSLGVTLYFIFSVDILSGFIFISLIITLIVFNRILMKKKQKLSRVAAAASTKLRGAIVDVFANISVMRQYNGSAYEQNTIGNLGVHWREAARANNMYSERTLVSNAIILFVFTGAMFYLLVDRWSLGLVTTAEFIFVLALITNLSGMLVFIGRVMTSIARVMGEAEEGLEELIIPHEISDKPAANPLLVPQGQIIWDDVTFEYGANKVFEAFNLTIAPGQRVGLVGSSGAGKTTFVSLLLRQHELQDGSILIDGQNIAAVTQDSLRTAIAIVPQEPALFHRTIRENIAYGKSDATDEEIIEVAKKAQAHDFIVSLPDGYNTLVGERGVKLSGGQKQRVAIARAMLKDAPILILDEATSALDSESEVAIQKALHVLMAGKTVVAIAHRLSTLREMDRIIVLENGKIIEDGTHETLAHAGGTYERLWNHQAGGFVGE